MFGQAIVAMFPEKEEEREKAAVQKELQSVVRQFWADHEGVAGLRGPVVVGVSGGADSLSLWHVLTTTAVVSPSHLTAVYVHHHLRPEADDEAQFVQETADAWGATAQVRHVDTPALIATHGYSVEEAARQLRYQALVACAREVGATVLLVAHTADDQAETVLMRLLRGSGGAGLRGMQPLTPLPPSLGDGGEPLWVARPFLSIWREHVEAYCQAHGLTPIQDSSNHDVAFLRNRVRHELLPYLAQYNPHIKGQLHHTAVVLTSENTLLDDLTQQAEAQIHLDEGAGWVRWQLAAWRAQPVALQRRLLRQAWRRVAGQTGQTLGFASLEQARLLLAHGRVGQEAVLASGVRVIIEYEAVVVARDRAVVPPRQSAPQLPPDLPETLLLPVPGHIDLLDGWRLTAEPLPPPSRAELTGSPDVVYLAVPPTAVLQVRGRRAGERFVPLGMGGHRVKLKELLINQKIPAAQREKWPLLVDERGILWVVGLAQAERTAVGEGSGVVVRVSLERSNEQRAMNWKS